MANCKNQSKGSKNKQDVFSDTTKAWEAIPTSVCENLVTSMSRRCQAVIDNNGFATKHRFFSLINSQLCAQLKTIFFQIWLHSFVNNNLFHTINSYVLRL